MWKERRIMYGNRVLDYQREWVLLQTSLPLCIMNMCTRLNDVFLSLVYSQKYKETVMKTELWKYIERMVIRYQDIFKILDHTTTQLSSGKQQNNKGKINTFIWNNLYCMLKCMYILQRKRSNKLLFWQTFFSMMQEF